LYKKEKEERIILHVKELIIEEPVRSNGTTFLTFLTVYLENLMPFLMVLL